MLFILLLLITNLAIIAQDSSNTTNEPLPVLNEFYYKFYPGDTITYRVSSRDSIIIEYGKPLTKDRYEIYEIICDSIGKKNKYYYLSYSLKSYIADESYGNMENARRTSSPWVNRTINFVMDSTGKRVHSYSKDSTLFAMSPGGAFQPHLFVTFNEIYKVDNESWIVSSTDTLAENGVPYPIMKQSTLFRAQLPSDTLGYQTYSASFIRTATGYVTTVTEDTKILVETIINLGGSLYLSKKDMIPIVMLATSEQKLKITTPQKEAMPGYHYTSVVYELDNFKPSKSRLEPVEVPKAKSKKKKNR